MCCCVEGWRAVPLVQTSGVAARLRLFARAARVGVCLCAIMAHTHRLLLFVR